jgi:ubiquinone/menaquinone biosynthesis C-methylase UbiE
MINEYFLEVFEGAPRQGPGSKAETEKAFKLLSDISATPAILDIGCGKGKQTFDLMELTEGHITAMDMHIPFLNKLTERIRKEKLQHRILPMIADMGDLPFVRDQFDLIWAEGSAYIIGYHRALSEWKKFLIPGGYLVFTDCVWMTDNPPKELVSYWEKEGLKMPTITQIIDKAKEEHYEIIEHFSLSHDSWRSEFYNYIEEEIERVRNRYRGNIEAQDTFFAIDEEIEMFDKYHDYFGYEFFVLRNRETGSI